MPREFSRGGPGDEPVHPERPPAIPPDVPRDWDWYFGAPSADRLLDEVPPLGSATTEASGAYRARHSRPDDGTAEEAPANRPKHLAFPGWWTHGAEPLADDPPVENPTFADPVVAEPTIAEPVVAEPTIAEPVVAEPVVAEPVVAEPVFDEPAEAHGEPGEAVEPAGDPWRVAFTALLRHIPDGPIRAATDDEERHKIIRREHHRELDLIRNDIVGYQQGDVRDPRTWTEAVEKLNRSGNVVTYEPSLVGYVLLALGKDVTTRPDAVDAAQPPAEIIAMFFAAAQLGHLLA